MPGWRCRSWERARGDRRNGPVQLIGLHQMRLRGRMRSPGVYYSATSLCFFVAGTSTGLVQREQDLRSLKCNRTSYVLSAADPVSPNTEMSRSRPPATTRNTPARAHGATGRTPTSMRTVTRNCLGRPRFCADTSLYVARSFPLFAFDWTLGPHA